MQRNNIKISEAIIEIRLTEGVLHKNCTLIRCLTHPYQYVHTNDTDLSEKSSLTLLYFECKEAKIWCQFWPHEYRRSTFAYPRRGNIWILFCRSCVLLQTTKNKFIFQYYYLCLYRIYIKSSNTKKPRGWFQLGSV